MGASRRGNDREHSPWVWRRASASGLFRSIESERMGWRAALVMASMTIVLLAAWWLNPPHPP